MQQARRQSSIVSAIKRLFVPITGLLSLFSTLSPASAQSVVSAEGAGSLVTHDSDQYDISGGTQAGGNLFHGFDEFSLAEQETANFLGDSSVFNIVGQVSGLAPSYIDGTVQVSGSDANLYLINPAGILFGENAQLSLQGSFTATTADSVGFGESWLDVLESGATDYSGLTADPSAFRFTDVAASAVVNQGDLAVAAGESLSLIGGNVLNTGSLKAPGGDIGLVAVGGESTVRFGIPGSLLSLEITEDDIPLGVGGGFSATELPDLLTGRSSSPANALTVRPDGSVRLAAVLVEPEEVAVIGEISTRSETEDGGVIALLGSSVDLSGEVVVDASGNNGGTILVGGGLPGQDTVPEAEVVLAHFRSVIQADGLAGKGGNVFIGAANRARVHSEISVQGTTAGGFVETSADYLELKGTVETHGQTDGGHWLIDPVDFEIVDGATGFNKIDPTTIENSLDLGSDVEITTTSGVGGNGDITLSSSINQLGGGTANLTLTGRRFDTNGSQINLTSKGDLTFEINQVNPEALTDASSIEAAIAAMGSVSGDRRIRLGAGTYDFARPVSINAQLAIEGAGTDLTRLTESAGGRVLDVLSDGDVVASNLTFLGGATNIGGGISVQGGTLTVENSLFDGNVAALGGAIYAAPGSALTVADSRFVDNTAANGGGISAVGATVAVTSGTRFEGNRATAGDGGGVDATYRSTVAISDTTFIGNEATSDGGGVSLQRGSVGTIDAGSRFVSNVATDDGGGIYLTRDSSAIVEDTQVIDNRAADDGGGLYVSLGSTAQVRRTTVEGNRAADRGGGLRVNSSTVTVEGAKFTNNRAVRGGAISLNSNATLQDTEILNNQATAAGGGIYSEGTLTLRAATLSGNRANSSGGGLYSVGDALVSESLFENNEATQGGGIGAGGQGMLSLTDTKLLGNQASQTGGGLYLSDEVQGEITGTLAVDASGVATTATAQIEGNRADVDGGGIEVGGESRLALNGALLRANEAGDDGGGIAVTRAGRVVIDNSNFERNQAADNGGALYRNNSNQNSPAQTNTVKLTQSRLIENRAANSGGGVFVGAFLGQVTVQESSLHANQAAANGGGVYLSRESSLQVERSTLVGNRAIAGGGLFNSGTAELSHATLSNNVATGDGGGIKNEGPGARFSVRNSTIYENQASRGGGIVASSADSTRVLSTIVAGNSNDENNSAGNTVAPGSDVVGRFDDQGHNLVGTAEGSSGFTNSLLVGTDANPIDSRLAPLADNGGPTQTHLLLSDSLAVNSGQSAEATDQRGFVRVLGSAADIGAVELDATTIPSSPAVTPAVISPNPNRPVVQEVVSVVDPTLLGDDIERVERLLGHQESERLSDNESVRRLEQNFGQGFEDYWDLSQDKALTFEGVQAILRRAQADYAVNSAVVYAAFVPEENAREENAREENGDILRFESEPAGDDQLHLSVVMPEGELVRYALPVTRKEAERQVRMLRSTTADPEDNFGYQALSQQLYQWLLAPLEEDLAAQGIQNLMYALDEGLRTVPVTAMRDYNGFSLERYGISVVPSVSLMQADFPVSVRRSTVAMGVSEFELEQPLPAVPIELEVVKKTVPVSQTLLNENTTSDAIAAIQTLEQPGVLHLATHATFDTHSPDSSAIHLWDGPLSMREFSELDWRESNLELLILSACDTAMSSRNAELGFAGLAAAAGVDATVGSLWQVSDIGTLALMSEFYAQLESTPLRFEALRRAQLSLLNGETRIENGNLLTSAGEVDLPDEWDLPSDATLAHPFYWSAFTMVGNPW